MPYTPDKLDRELRTAGLPIHGVDSAGNITWNGTPTQGQLDSAAAIKAAHNPAVGDADRDNFALFVRKINSLTNAQMQTWVGQIGS